MAANYQTTVLEGTTLSDRIEATLSYTPSTDTFNIPLEIRGFGGDDSLISLGPMPMLVNGEYTVDLGSHLFGGDGNDGLVGSNRSDTLFGGLDDDGLNGGGGDDYLEGGAGNDVVWGGDDRDLVLGGLGADTLEGNGENDTLDAGAGGFSDFVYGGGGDDTLLIASGSSLADGGLGTDTLFGSGDISMAHLSAEHFIAGSLGATLSASQINGFSTVQLGANATLSMASAGTVGANFSVTAPGFFRGSPGADTIDLGAQTQGWGLESGDTIGGNLLIGGAGNDFLSSTSTLGGDTLNGNGGDDTLLGGAGNDTLYGGGNANSLNDGAGDDTFYGDSGNDTLTGASGNDTIYGDSGNDTLIDGSGNDTLFGLGGEDRLVPTFGGTDTFDGGSGIDTLDASSIGSGVTIDLSTSLYTDGSGAIDTLVGIEYVIGSGFGDTIIGNGTNNILFGGTGADLLSGLALTDQLRGGLGNDTLDGGSGGDTAVFDTATLDLTVDLGTGLAIHAGGERDTLIGIEYIWGGSARDTLIGDGNDNGLSGGFGDDTVFGGAGADGLSADPGNDLLDGGSGTLDYASFGAGSGANADLAAGTATDGAGGLDTLVGIEYLFGGIGNDMLAGDGGVNLLDGENGDDGLYGRGGDDRLLSSAGNDTFDGGDGVDYVSYADAEAGIVADLAFGTVLDGSGGTNSLVGIEVVFGSFLADTIVGGLSGDWLEGGFDNDTLFGGAGNDTLVGGNGNDRLDGGDGNDAANYALGPAVTVDLGAGGASDGLGGFDTLVGIETVFGSGAGDMVLGNGGANRIEGNGGGDSLAGSGGDDSLFGGAGDDSLDGGDGNDRLDGGSGGDSLDGGAGLDTVDYGSLTNALNIQLHTSLADAGAQGGFDLFVAIENAVAGSSSDQIWGNHFGNVLVGNAGDDWLHGFGANDTLYGGDGSDQVLGGDNADTLYGGDGNDYFWFDNQDAVFGGAGEDYAYNAAAGGVTVNLATSELEGVWAGNDQDVLDASAATWSVQLIGYAGGDTLRGGTADDYVWFDADDTVTGGAGRDSGYATGNNVAVNYAAQGMEQIWASNGNDTLDASGMSDTALLIAYAGTDTVLGGSGNDYMWVDWDTTDTVNGGAGRDEMYQIGGGGVTLDLGARGLEAILGSNVTDVLDGATQTQWLLLLGLGGNDTLTGGINNDYLFGGDGDDTIRGGAGNDFFLGGAGSDTFVHTAQAGGSGTDQFLDFESGDKVLVSGNAVVSGFGSSTVVLTDGSTLMAANGYNWLAADFI